MNPIDYSPLENAFSAPLQTAWGWFNVKRLLIVIGIVSIMAVLPFVGLGNLDGLIIFVVFVVLVLKAALSNADTWTAFAKANNWQINQTYIEDIPPGIRGIGEYSNLGIAILAKYEGRVQRLYKYDYTEGIGDFQTTHTFTILRIELPKVFPHIVLDSQKNEDGIRRLFKNYQKVSLENNFDKYFRMYIQQNEEVDALSIITPNVMSHLIDSSVKLDLEIAGNNLYFIATNANQSKSEIKYMLESTNPVIDDVFHRAKSLNYKPNEIQDVDELSGRPHAPLTLTTQSKVFAVIIGIISLALFALILFLVKQTLSVQSLIK